MKIHLEHVAMLKIHGATNGSDLDLAEATTLRNLLDQLGISPDHQRSVTTFVNDAKVPHDHLLRDGDHVFLSIPTSGG